MKNFRYQILLLLLSNFALIEVGFALEKFPDIQVITSSQNGISILYSPPTQKITAENLPDLFKLAHYGIVTDPGKYRMPVRNHLIAIPPGAKVAVNISSLKTHNLSGVTLEKNPIDSSISISYNENIISITPQFITVSQSHRFRRYEVVKLTLHPAIYNPNSRNLTVLEEAHFNVSFQGGKISGYIEPHSENLKKLILNYQQAKNWGLPPQPTIESGFPQGTLLKIIVNEEGIYRLDYETLQNLNLDLTQYPLNLISLYNNGGRELSTAISAPVLDSLIENRILVQDLDGDNVFDPEDYILFYGTGTWGLEETSPGYYSHYINHYTFDNVYWLELKTSGLPGLRMNDFALQGSYSVTVQTTKARVYREDEKVIYANSSFPGSGLDWYGDLFSGPMIRTYTHSLNDVANGYYKIKLKLRALESQATFKVYWNNTFLANISTATIPYSLTGNNLTVEGLNTLKLENISSSSAYLDWYEIEYQRYLSTGEQNNEPEIYFESPLGSGLAFYESLLGLSEEAYIFKVSQFVEVAYTRGNSFKDNLSSSSAERYYACDESAFKTPNYISLYTTPPSDFTDLRLSSNKADYLFITHSDFYSGLNDIVNLWAEKKNIMVERVNVAQIFDQFSGGLYDPTAIRNFLRYALDHWDIPPSMVALVGDGDYDYLNRISENDQNWIPPYENGTSCTDDFYTYLHSTGDPEIAIGRYTVTSAQEMGIVSDKMMKYVGDPEFGPWKKRFIVVADDEFGEAGVTNSSEQEHVKESETLADNYLPSFYSIKKIYLTEYPVAPGAGGRQKPSAADDLIEAINQGAVMCNYFGHGNETVWAHEAVFEEERDLPRIDNGYKLNYFVAATCTWSYFDNAEHQSMPELLLTMPAKGAIAAIGASRMTGSGPNEDLIYCLYPEIYEDSYNPQAVGEALQYSKILYSSANAEKYHLIGDPMVAPCSPTNSGQIISMSPDSLFALNLTTLSGQLFQGGNLWDNFQGTVYLEVEDAAVSITYHFYNSESTVVYELPGNTIFRGPFSTFGGNFNSQFIVPMDITYGGELGRVGVYFTDQVEDGFVFRDSIYIGAGGNVLQDTDPPDAQIYFGDRAYRPGDQVSSSPLIILDLNDSSGINLTGSPGHEIMLYADEVQEFDLTDYFEYQVNSYREGGLEHQLSYLVPGLHQMKLRVWDSFNHPYQLEFTLETVATEPTADYLSEILNYPNPFSRETSITFKIIEAAEVEIEIYTVGGRLIKKLGPEYCTPVFVYDRFSWDGRDFEGDKVANGVYLYKVKAKFSGETISKIGRLIVMR